MNATSTKENLCDTCLARHCFPECMPDEVFFGDGLGNDNIIDCENYDKIKDEEN